MAAEEGGERADLLDLLDQQVEEAKIKFADDFVALETRKAEHDPPQFRHFGRVFVYLGLMERDELKESEKRAELTRSVRLSRNSLLDVINDRAEVRFSIQGLDQLRETALVRASPDVVAEVNGVVQLAAEGSSE